MEVVLEEVPIPGTRMSGDFLVPARRLAVEVHGEQHRTFSAHFHKTKAAFLDSLKRDSEKARFYELNGITLVVLWHDETDDEWRDRLRAS